MAAKSYLNPAVFDLSYLVSDAEKVVKENARIYHPGHIQVMPTSTQTAALGAPNQWSRYVTRTVGKEGYADRYARYHPRKEGAAKSALSTMESVLGSLAKEVSERYQRVSTWAQTQMGAIYDAVSQVFPQSNGLSYAHMQNERKERMEKGPLPIQKDAGLPLFEKMGVALPLISKLRETYNHFLKGMHEKQIFLVGKK